MSQENVEMIERMYEAFYRGDAEGALANFDPGWRSTRPCARMSGSSTVATG